MIHITVPIETMQHFFGEAIEAWIFIAGIVISAVMVGAFVLWLRRAPEGYQDETGFHRARRHCAQCDYVLDDYDCTAGVCPKCGKELDNE